MEYDATPETEIRPNTDNQPKFKAKFLFFLLNIDSGSRSASYAILFAQCFLFFRDITKTLSIFFGKLLKITYWRDVKRGYVFIKNIALLNLNIAQTAQAHRVTLHIISYKFLNHDFSFPLWQVISKCKQTLSLVLLCVKLVISYLAEIVSVKVLIPEVNVNCSRKLKLKVCWPRISSFSFAL